MTSFANHIRTGVVATVVLFAALAAIAWGVGDRGLTASEGHRAIPGWEIMESGELVPTRLFGTPYLRKPPGMPWAVAAVSTWVGPTELAARLVSVAAALLSALAVGAFTARWFRRVDAGLIAAAAQLLLPRFALSARTAEIEPAYAAAVQLACLGVLDLALTRRDGPAGWLAFVTGTALTLLFKGPAGLPFILAAIAAALLLGARPGRVAIRAVVGGAVAAIPYVLVIVLTARRVAGEPEIVTEQGSFLWTNPFWQIIVLPVAIAGAGLPHSLALLFPWGGDAAAEARDQPVMRRGYAVARACAMTFLIAMVILVVAGVSNPRYGLPAMLLLPPMVPYVVEGAATRFRSARRRIGRMMLLGHVLVWPLVLLGVVIAFRDDHPESGRALGHEFATMLPEGWRGTIVAEEVVNTRPEVLLYLVRAARAAGREVEGRWNPALLAGPRPDPGSLVLLDDVEVEAAAARWSEGAVEVLHRGTVHEFEFVLVRIGR